jgi:hypothetical protein
VCGSEEGLNGEEGEKEKSHRCHHLSLFFHCYVVCRALFYCSNELKVI